MTVTVIIPCHNGERTLERTFRSVSDQTCADWAAIAVNDRSTDSTPAILTRLAEQEPRLRVIDGPGKGASAARNAALGMAETEFLAFLDADDLWQPDRIATILRLFDRRADVDIAYSRFAFFNENPGDNRTVSTVPAHPLGVLDLMRENPVGTMSNLVMRRAALEATGPFREDITHGEDREWLVRAAARGLAIVGIDETLLNYRTSVGGLSTDLEKMYDGWRKSVQSAAALDALPPPGALRSAEAVYLRYLSRRAMRLGMPPKAAVSYALRGVRLSPRGFFSDGSRGPLTLGSALASLIAPRTMRDTLSNR